jgi:hypothetical protein
MYSSICDFLYPALDYDLFDYAAGLPYAYLKQARLCRRAIEVYSPELAQVPWDLTGLPLGRSRGSGMRSLKARLNKFQYYLGRITHGMLDFSVPVTSANRLFRHDKGFRSHILGVLDDPRTFSRGIIDERGLKRLVGFQDSGRNYLSVMWGFMTIEKFFRKLIDD